MTAIFILIMGVHAQVLRLLVLCIHEAAQHVAVFLFPNSLNFYNVFMSSVVSTQADSLPSVFYPRSSSAPFGLLLS